jgi:hypothetical protein
MFASSTLTEHVLRGVVGGAAFAAAMVYSADVPLLGLVLLPVALIALRGCPMCWTMGLFETVANKFRRSADVRGRYVCTEDGCTRVTPQQPSLESKLTGVPRG